MKKAAREAMIALMIVLSGCNLSLGDLSVNAPVNANANIDTQIGQPTATQSTSPATSSPTPTSPAQQAKKLIVSRDFKLLHGTEVIAFHSGPWPLYSGSYIAIGGNATPSEIIYERTGTAAHDDSILINFTQSGAGSSMTMPGLKDNAVTFGNPNGFVTFDEGKTFYLQVWVTTNVKVEADILRLFNRKTIGLIVKSIKTIGNIPIEADPSLKTEENIPFCCYD